VTALVIPSLREPYALRVKRLRKAIEADIKDGNRGFKQRAMRLLERVKELDEAANRIQGRLHQLEKYLGDAALYHTAGRRGRPSFNRAGRRKRAGGLPMETEVIEEELITRKRLEEKAEKFRVQLKNTAALMEKMGHRIKRLSFGAEDTAPTDKELREIIEEIEVEVEALEELHDKT
jgi:methyl-accepting chemotaxis protein